MAQIIDGRKIKEQILAEVKKDVLTLPFPPVFCDILVGTDLSSVQYVRMKGKVAESVGIKFRTAEFPASITTEELKAEVLNLNRVPHMCGIIIQLPLPAHIDKKVVLDAIEPSLDVDCLGVINSENFYLNEGQISFPTALACLYILESLKLDLKKNKILILGQGRLVGRPLTHLLKTKGYEVWPVDIDTKDKENLIKQADIIVTAIGQAKFLKAEMLKDGVVLIDAGTSEENGAILGDVDLDSVIKIASYVSPTPGGVGPVTVAMLLRNVLQVAKSRLEINNFNQK